MSNDRFEVVVHHGGTLIKEVPFNYIGGEICYWDIDPDTWSYFGVVGSLKDLGYIEVHELYYDIEHVLYKVYDDKGALNMMNVGKLLGKVNLYVVHKVSEAVVVENEDEILYLCQGPVESGEGSGVEVGVEGPVEVQQEVEEGPLYCGGDLERDDGVQVDTEELGGVEEEVEVHSEEEVEVHSEEDVQVHSEEEVQLHTEEEVQLHTEEEVEVNSEEEVEVDSEEEVEVDSEEEVEVDTEDEAHFTVEENLEEVGNLGIALGNSDSEYRMEDSDNEAQGDGRGLSDDEWKSDLLLTPDNSGSEEDETEDKPSRGPVNTQFCPERKKGKRGHTRKDHLESSSRISVGTGTGEKRSPATQRTIAATITADGGKPSLRIAGFRRERSGDGGVLADGGSGGARGRRRGQGAFCLRRRWPVMAEVVRPFVIFPVNARHSAPISQRPFVISSTSVCQPAFVLNVRSSYLLTTARHSAHISKRPSVIFPNGRSSSPQRALAILNTVLTSVQPFPFLLFV
ncbi:hypothetical protein LR48_Vigan07g103100 [Vigna angularis]|uniref:PB1-like domain-containing protein n=1 Tax=Phaseolus angularis TaxID=3914 RepID=A0A0L9UXL1_PHAAN|nr:hypothetical protein LR48_Vigan07g103100 [Vigna angularis]